MAENYSLNNGFGFNVSKKGVNTGNVQHTIENIDKSVGNLFDTMTEYVSKYENVFNGNVESEINMYTRQAMIVGMNLRAENGARHSFDMNI